MREKLHKSRPLNSFIKGEVDVLIIPVNEDGTISSETLRNYVQENLWDSNLESRIQGIIGQFCEGRCYVYENAMPRVFRAQIYVPNSAKLCDVFRIIAGCKYTKVAIPCKENIPIYKLTGAVPRNIICTYYQM